MPDTGPIDLAEGGWAVFTDLPGWEAHDVAVKVAQVNGEPRVVGVRIEPTGDVPVSRRVLTTARLRRLPVAVLARVVWALHNPLPDLSNIVGALDTAADALPDEQRTGRPRATTAEAVARVYADARARGNAPRAAVCKVLHISSRTADRYISEARRRGLLAPYTQEGSEK